MGYVVDRVAMGQVLPGVIFISSVRNIPQVLHAHSINHHQRFTIPVTDTVVKYHTKEYHLLFHQCPYSFICCPGAGTIERLAAAVKMNSVAISVKDRI
jgi:hypothetical protein